MSEAVEGALTASSAVPRPVGEAGFRDTMARFATGVTVVTCVQDGFDHAMTANSFTSVSLDPPLVLVSVEDDSRFHEALSAVGTWAVSVLAEHQKGRASWFATRGRPLVAQFDAARPTGASSGGPAARRGAGPPRVPHGRRAPSRRPRRRGGGVLGSRLPTAARCCTSGTGSARWVTDPARAAAYAGSAVNFPTW